MELLHVRDHEIWKTRNDKLPERLLQFFKHTNPSESRLSITTDRFKMAAGEGTDTRLGLVFSSVEQQAELAEDFARILNENDYGTFSLVGTGTSFQVLSTNPAKPENWFFGQGELDLDLQIYCPSLVQVALTHRVELFPNMYDVLISPFEVRLSTFHNYSIPNKGIRGLDEIAPWVHELEILWEKILANTWGEPCFVHAALMNHDTIPHLDLKIGSPFELIQYKDGRRIR